MVGYFISLIFRAILLVLAFNCDSFTDIRMQLLHGKAKRKLSHLTVLIEPHIIATCD